jgi:hypothetical protein
MPRQALEMTRGAFVRSARFDCLSKKSLPLSKLWPRAYDWYRSAARKRAGNYFPGNSLTTCGMHLRCGKSNCSIYDSWRTVGSRLGKQRERCPLKRRLPV